MERLLWVAALLSTLCCSLKASPAADLKSKPRSARSSDAGSSSLISSCVVPDAPSCGVDYAVPSSIANIATDIEMDIDSLFNVNFANRYTPDCRDAVKRIACAQRFPRCVEGWSKVELTSLQCEEMLRLNCNRYRGHVQELLDEGYCSLPNSTQDIAVCKSVAEFAGGAGELRSCLVDEEWRMTAWMYELLRFYDSLMASTSDKVRGRYGSFYDQCLELQANFTCHWAGRCSADGKTVESDITYQLCQNFLTWCVSFNFRGGRARVFVKLHV